MPTTIDVQVLRDPAELPSYARSGDAGADLVTTEDIVIGPGERRLVPTGIAVAIPNGYAGFILPRSGLALKHGISIVNAPGTIDSGYRGEVKVILINLDTSNSVTLAAGDRVAQLVVQRVEAAAFKRVDQLPSSERGDGGFGSTG